MSDEPVKKSDLVLLWTQRILGPLMAILLSATGFALKEVFTSVKAMNTRITALEILMAQDQAVKFSAVDGSRERTLLSAESVSVDRRVTRLEESIPYIKESLGRIEKQLEK